jgi:hypothetical protein
MKNFLKRKKQAQAPEPRSMDEINKEYSELTVKAAKAQYLVYVHTLDLEHINKRQLYVNQEAQARMEIDKNAVQKQQEGAIDAKP